MSWQPVQLLAGANDTLVQVQALTRESDGVVVNNATVMAEISSMAGDVVVSEFSLTALGTDGNYQASVETALEAGRQYRVEITATGPGRAEWEEVVVARTRGFGL